jgi:hypothetical protein
MITVNLLDGIFDIFKELVWDNLVKATLTEIFVAVPLLGWGPIGFVITSLAVKYSDKLYNGINKVVDVKAIALKDEILKREYDSASIKLKIIANSYGINSSEFEVSRVAHKNYLSQFVRFDRARSST